MKYDHYSKDYLMKHSFIGKMRHRLYHTIFENLGIKSTLEIGVGLGEFAYYCKSNNIEYVGIEPNDNLRDDLKNKGYNVVNGKAPGLPKLDRKFDCLFASHLIEHLKDCDEIIKLAENAKLILNEDGYIIFLYPDVEKSPQTYYLDYTHLYPTTKRRVENILKDCDLEIVKSKYYIGVWVKPAYFLYFAGKMLPYFLFPERIRNLLRAKFQMCGFTVAKIKNRKDNH